MKYRVVKVGRNYVSASCARYPDSTYMSEYTFDVSPTINDAQRFDELLFPHRIARYLHGTVVKIRITEVKQQLGVS